MVEGQTSTVQNLQEQQQQEQSTMTASAVGGGHDRARAVRLVPQSSSGSKGNQSISTNNRHEKERFTLDHTKMTMTEKTTTIPFNFTTTTTTETTRTKMSQGHQTRLSTIRIQQPEEETIQLPASSSISSLSLLTLLGVAAPRQEPTLSFHRLEENLKTTRSITPDHHKGPTMYTTQPHRKAWLDNRIHQVPVKAVCLVPQSHGSKGTSVNPIMTYETMNCLNRLVWQDASPRLQGPMKWPGSTRFFALWLCYLCCMLQAPPIETYPRHKAVT